jgi:hypothetical protein
MDTKQIKVGSVLKYDDGRNGHIGVRCIVLAVDAEGMDVMFEDRADTTSIAFHESAWMVFLSLCPAQ